MSEPGKQNLWRLLLSHHDEQHLDQCFAFGSGAGRVFVCARCLGLYPAMLAMLVLGRLTGPWPAWLEWTALLGLPLPALLEWGVTVAGGRRPAANWVRLLTGSGLGASIGASLHVNTYALLAEPVRAQFVFFLAVVWVVWLASYLRRLRWKLLRLRRLTRQRRRLAEGLLANLQGSSCEKDTKDTGDSPRNMRDSHRGNSNKNQ